MTGFHWLPCRQASKPTDYGKVTIPLREQLKQMLVSAMSPDPNELRKEVLKQYTFIAAIYAPAKPGRYICARKKTH
jgi:hypothetical protein